MRVEDLHYIVFSGGGARGIAFAGACAELWSLLRFDVSRLKGTSGTSIGALYAAAVASGMHPSDLLRVAKATSLIDLVRPHVSNLVTHWGFDDSKILEEWIDEHLGGVRETFQQLYERTGRVLKVTATDLHTCECYIIDHESEPDMPVCRGVAMSMCLPPLFAPMEHRGHLMVDGGICNNFPIDVFDSPAHTLGIKVTWGHVSDLKGFEKYFARLTYCTLATAERKIWQSLEEEYRRNTLVVDCGDVSTMNWRLPETSVRAIVERGRCVVREFVLTHDWRALPIPTTPTRQQQQQQQQQEEQEQPSPKREGDRGRSLEVVSSSTQTDEPSSDPEE